MAEFATIVPGGEVGSGPAQVLDVHAKDPYLTYRQRQAYKEELAMMKQQMAADAAQKNFDAWNTSMKWSPDKTWEPFSQQLYDRANEVQRFKADVFNSGYDIRNPNVAAEVTRRQNDVQAFGQKMLGLKQQHDGIYKIITDDNEYGPRAQQALYRTFFDPKTGKAYDGDAINPARLQADVLDDPYNYNHWQIWKNVTDALPEITDKWYQTNRTALGEYFDIKEFKGKLFERDDNGKLVTENGRPVVRITDELMDMLESTHPKIRRMVEVAKAQGIDRRDVFEQMKNFDQPSYTQTPSGFRKYDTDNGSGENPPTMADYKTEYGVMRNYGYNTTNENAPRNRDGSPKPTLNVTKDEFVPAEIRLGGSRLDRDIKVQSVKVRDLRNGGMPMGKFVGDQKFVPTRVQLRWTQVPAQEGMGDKDRGHYQEKVYAPENKEEFEKQMAYWASVYRANKAAGKNYLAPKWYVQGDLHLNTGDESIEVVPTFMPIDDLRGEMEKGYGIDLTKRPLQEYEYWELVFLGLDRYPEASLEQVYQWAATQKGGSTPDPSTAN